MHSILHLVTISMSHYGTTTPGQFPNAFMTASTNSLHGSYHYQTAPFSSSSLCLLNATSLHLASMQPLCTAPRATLLYCVFFAHLLHLLGNLIFQIAHSTRLHPCWRPTLPCTSKHLSHHSSRAPPNATSQSPQTTMKPHTHIPLSPTTSPLMRCQHTIKPALSCAANTP